MKGALVELVPAAGGSAPNALVPNVIVFQFNPETLKHSFTQTLSPPPPSGHQESDPLAVSGPPGETFSFTLILDSNDQLADSDASVADDAKKFGLYTRLAALEMLIHPTAIANLLKEPPGGRRKGKRNTPAALVPVVLFVWGPGRILPVRVTSLSFNETLYDAALLNPTHAEVQIELRVLTTDDLKGVKGKAQTLANAAYKYALGLR